MLTPSNILRTKAPIKKRLLRNIYVSSLKYVCFLDDDESFVLTCCIWNIDATRCSFISTCSVLSLSLTTVICDEKNLSGVQNTNIDANKKKIPSNKKPFCHYNNNNNITC